MGSSATYTYEALPNGKYTRVLKLLPAKSMKSPIQLELRIVPIQRPMASLNTYEALSYVWGDPTPVETVYCGGKSLQVAANCFQALKYLRKQRAVRTLWIDAICINQRGPVEEKGKQIALMEDIYKEATTVLIWMGDERGKLWWLMQMGLRGSWWCRPLSRIAKYGI